MKVYINSFLEFSETLSLELEQIKKNLENFQEIIEYSKIEELPM